MGRQPVSAGGRADVAAFRQVLLGRLGLDAGATDQDVEEAHDGLMQYLERVPAEMRSWAAVRSTEVDEAYALLSGPEQDLTPPQATSSAAAQGILDKTLGTPPVPASSVPASADSPGAYARPRYAPAAPKAPVTDWRQNKVVWAIVPLLLVAVIYGVFQMGRGSEVPDITGTPTGTETTASGAATPTPVDQVKVAALLQKITANPKDIVSLQGLGDIYFAATDYKNATLWEQKLLAVDPKNKKGLISYGAAMFNQNKPAEAKKSWLVAAKLYPKEAEVHYDLGFLYLSQTPPDKVNMAAEWKKVVDIDPSSKLAQTVSAHTQSATPTASATPGAK